MPAFGSVREKNTGFPDMERICPDAAVGGGGSCRGDDISAGILENAAELKRGSREIDSHRHSMNRQPLFCATGNKCNEIFS